MMHHCKELYISKIELKARAQLTVSYELELKICKKASIHLGRSYHGANILLKCKLKQIHTFSIACRASVFLVDKS